MSKMEKFRKRLERDRDEAQTQEEFFREKNFQGSDELVVSRRSHRTYVESLIEDLDRALAESENPKIRRVQS